MNVRVDLQKPIRDGMEVVFRSPVDCSQVTGLKLYYPENDIITSREFAFADAHGNNVGDIDHLFAENVVVKVILDASTGMAFVQNADTNAYIERTFVKTINGVGPDANGNVLVAGGGGGATITVDSELSETSENPVQNKVVTANFNGAMQILQSQVIPNLLPAVTEADNGKALVAVNGVWTPVAVSVPTDEHINALIDAKLGVIENGTY